MLPGVLVRPYETPVLAPRGEFRSVYKEIDTIRPVNRESIEYRDHATRTLGILSCMSAFASLSDSNVAKKANRIYDKTLREDRSA